MADEVAEPCVMEKLPDSEQRRLGIWLEVAEVRYEGGANPACSVLLKADREYPKPVWWPVKEKAVKGEAYETYTAILNELDKKRTVLARLSYCTGTDASKAVVWLQCDSFRFQSPDSGSR